MATSANRTPTGNIALRSWLVDERARPSDLRLTLGRTTRTSGWGDDFDPVKAVADFRRVIAQRDAATTDIDRAEYEGIAKRMRAAWKAWNGDDELREMAFGEPYDE